MRKLRLAMGSAPAIAAWVGCGLLVVSTAGAQTASEPHPGTAESLRRYIDSLERGKPNYEEMGPQLARIVREELPQVLDIIYRIGAFQSMVFQRVDDNGMDVYRVAFEHGQIEWHIAPLSSDGKVLNRGFHELP